MTICLHVQMRGMSSALSAASSACDHMRDWIHGTPSGTFMSMGVFSDGSYNAPKVPFSGQSHACLQVLHTAVQAATMSFICWIL